MDAFTDPSVEGVVVMSSAQVGKTEILNNIVGYFVDQDPSPILVVQPTLEMGEAWSKDRLAPMLRDTPRLRDKVKDPRSRDSGNTLLHKTFPGGHLTIAGSNSAASLASRPIRIVLCDEVDRYPSSAGTEGDPVSLALQRTSNFWNRKWALFSTPTIKDASRIEAAYETSDQRKLAVPCPKCGEFQFLFWGSEGNPGGIKWDDGNPDTAYYECVICKAHWADSERARAIRFGKWEPTQPFNGVAGFWLSAIASPWVEARSLVKAWGDAQRSPELLKTFVNTKLGQTWEERHEKRMDPQVLFERCESYEDEVPEGVAVITAFADVQADRLECEIVGWGRDEESWSLAYHVIPGDIQRNEVWADLDQILSQEFVHPSGVRLRVRSAGVDSGYQQGKVLQFTRPRFGRRVYATKGDTGGNGPIWPRKPSRKNQTPFFMLGVNAAKDAIDARLWINEPGPGHCHFPADRAEYGLEYFEQLTAERKVTTYHNGFPKRQWKKKESGARNEAWDCRVGNYCILHGLYSAGLKLNAEADRVARLMEESRKRVDAPPVAAPVLEQTRSGSSSWLGDRTQNWFRR